MTTSLADQYPQEQKRCRELLEHHIEIGVGRFVYAEISAVLERAERAAASQDVVAMLRSFAEMQGCE